MYSHFSKLFIALFFAITSVILSVDYIYSEIEAQNSFEQDVETIWLSLYRALDRTSDEFQIVAASELAWPQEQISKLKSKGVLLLDTGTGKSLFHGYIATQDSVYITELPRIQRHNQQWFWWLLVYGALASVIFLWLYPLIRDIKILQEAAIEFGKSKSLPPVIQNNKSPVFPIADALTKMTRQIQRLMSLQRDITTYAWHDIRTPLSRIRFACELLDEPSSQQLKKNIVDEISEIELLLNELLLYAEFEYSQPSIKLQSIDLHLFCQQIIEQFEKVSAIKIHNLVAPGSIVTVDVNLFKRGIVNLVGNCLRYANQNVWVSFATDDQWRCLVVEDDGPGITTEELQYITLPFVRDSNAEDEHADANNSGLGLAIVETICQWHGGVFKVGNSAQRAGARFVMQFN